MKQLLTIVLIMCLSFCFILQANADVIYDQVPSYDQNHLDYDLDGTMELPSGACSEFAIAMVMGYYDAVGWKRFVPYGSELSLKNPVGVYDLVNKVISYTNSGADGLGLLDYIYISTKINSLSKALDSNANFTTNYDNVGITWNLVKNSLTNNGPGLFNTARFSYIPYYLNNGTYASGGIDNHAMASIGFKENFPKWGATANWLQVKSTWTNSDTLMDPWWINWDDIGLVDDIGYLHFYEGGTPSSPLDTTDDTYEDNDYHSDAKVISSTFNSSSLECNDHDWYKVFMNTGDTLDVTINFTNSNGDLDLELYSSSNTLLGSSTSMSNQETVSYTASLSGFYHIKVYGYNGAKNLYSMSIIGDDSHAYLPRTGQTTCYNSSGGVINCAGTGQDGDIQAGVEWPNPRFTSGTGAEAYCITDNLTGLMWSKNGNIPNGAMVWNNAINSFDNLAFCGYSDWRLPNVREIESLLNYGEPYTVQWLHGYGFENVQPAEYWSSTAVDFAGGNVQMALTVNLGTNAVNADATSYSNYFVWPVRSAITGTIQLPETGQTLSNTDGDDGDLREGVSWPEPRFSDLGDGTVRDNLTGLMWLKDASCFGFESWQNTLQTLQYFNANPNNYNCQDLTIYYSDWRLPNIRELFSLIDYTNRSQALPSNHPFIDVWGMNNWSSTLNLTIYMDYGLFNFAYSDTTMWPVRSGQSESFDYYCDSDDDGHYSKISQTCTGNDCVPSACRTTPGDDCDDSEGKRYPGNTEVCDQLDNDCNTSTADGSGEGWYGNQMTCGQGVCYSTGHLTCSSGSQFNTCTIGSPTGNDTDCDNVDDDCDGSVDEHYVSITTNCGIGVCASTGQTECQSGTEVDICIAGTPTENPESTCNDGLDNDCDTMIDTLDPTSCYPQNYYCDGDGDGHADHLSSGTCVGNECQAITCQFTTGDDCDDSNINLWYCNTTVSDDPVTISDDSGNSVIFTRILSGGNTIITADTCQPGDVEGIALTETTVCVDITTDAEFDGMVEVCLTYDDMDMTQQVEESLRMIRCDDQGNCDLIDEARPNDTVNNIVCGLTDHFSIFAVGIPLDSDNDTVFDLQDNCSQTPNPEQQDTDEDGYGNICDADLDNDGAVGFQDFTIFKAAWLATTSSGNWNPDADFDSDNAVGFQDFTIFKGRWLSTAPWE